MESLGRRIANIIPVGSLNSSVYTINAKLGVVISHPAMVGAMDPDHAFDGVVNGSGGSVNNGGGGTITYNCIRLQKQSPHYVCVFTQDLMFH